MRTRAVFEMTRLRPEQVIGSMLQASSLKTIDKRSSLLVRIQRFLRETDFVRDYGDLGDDEFAARSGTVSQALLRMNGRLTDEIIRPELFNASSRIADFARTPEETVEVIFLTCLTRRPTREEKDALLPMFEAANEEQRKQLVADLYWALFNQVDFSWTH